MDIMDIQAVESKLSDVTVTPIPRSQVQNFYNYQQQREQREQQPQIQISAIHAPRNNAVNEHAAHQSSSMSSVRDIYGSKRDDRDYHSNAPATTAAALLYSQQLQAQLALLQQQSNTAASLSSLTRNNNNNNNNNNHNHNHNSNNAIHNSSGHSGHNNNNNNNNNSITASIVNALNASAPLKYPESSSPLVITTQTSSNITTPLTSTANLPTPNSNGSGTGNGLSKYGQLLAVIEEMGRDIRPTYTGSRCSTERLKRGLMHARVLVRECLMETERSARQ